MNAMQPHIEGSGEQHCQSRAGGVRFDPKIKNTTQLHLGRLLQTLGWSESEGFQRSAQTIKPGAF